MAGRHYNDKEKAFAIAELQSNEGNVKRTSRHTGIPAPTIRRWKQEMEREGIPESVAAELEPIMSDFIEDAIRVRAKLLRRLEEAVDKGTLTPGQVSTSIGIISDKIRAYEAIRETRRVEHKISLPSAEELKELMVGVLDGVVESAQERAAEIEAVMEPAAITTYSEIPSGE